MKIDFCDLCNESVPQADLEAAIERDPLHATYRYELGMLVLGGAIFGLARYYPERITTDDWKSLVATLRAYERPGDAVTRNGRTRRAAHRTLAHSASPNSSAAGPCPVTLAIGLSVSTGRPSDAVAACQWFRAAANSEHVSAQLALGTMYCLGRGVAQSERGPSVSASWGSGRSEALGDQVAPNDSFSASLQVSWEADVFKAKRLSVAASQADLESEEENLRAVQVSLVAETVVAYTDLRVAEARLGVAKETL